MNNKTATMNESSLAYTKKEFKKRSKEVFRAWLNYRKIRGCLFKEPKTLVIVQPNNEVENSFYSILFLDDLLRTTGMKKAWIITSDYTMGKVYPLFCDKSKVNIALVNKLLIDDFVTYFSLRVYETRVIIADLDVPFGRHGSKICRPATSISREEAFAYGVYRLWVYEYHQLPVYKGNDSDILKYMDWARCLRDSSDD